MAFDLIVDLFIHLLQGNVGMRVNGFSVEIVGVVPVVEDEAANVGDRQKVDELLRLRKLKEKNKYRGTTGICDWVKRM